VARRRNVNQIFEPVLSAQVVGADFDKLVYLLVANRPHRYPKDSSRIVYIGTTKKGLWRMALSASEKIYKGYDKLHGFTRLDGYVIWSRTRKGPGTFKGRPFYRILERAALIVFKETFGDIPVLNGNGGGIKEENEFKIFARRRIERILGRYS
jgi:hypothetical protein